MAHALRSHLFKCYGSFADKRIKNVEKGRIFIVDGRDRSDIGADGQLLGYFCMIFAMVDSDTELAVEIRGNIPRSAGVDDFFKHREVAVDRSASQPCVQLKIYRKNVSDLRELADQFAAIVAPGRRYDTSNYKYVCPRTASALRQLADYLDKYSWQKSGFF